MKKKFFILIMLLLTSFFVVKNNVEAYSLANGDVQYSLASDEQIQEDCDALFGDPNNEDDFAYFLQEIFDVMKYAGPILCLVFSVMDFIKATSGQDKDLLMKATKKTIIRVVLAMILFFVPGLINFLFGLIGWYGTCGIG